MQLQALLGIFVFLGIAWAVSEKRRQVRLSTVVLGVLMQFVIAGVLLYVPFFKRIFLSLNDVVIALDAATREGSAFVFGYLGGGTPPLRFCSSWQSSNVRVVSSHPLCDRI